MTWVLIRKELQQHSASFLVLGVVISAGLVTISGNPFLNRALGSGFEGVLLLYRTILPLAGIVLSTTLIATEFRQKTQLFLEGLPLPRWRMLVVKYVFMLVSLGGVALLALALGWWRSRSGEAMTPNFVALLATKSMVWAWCVAALFFAMGFLGRYRVAFGIISGVSLLWMHSSGAVDLGEVAPFSLLDGRFAYEREVWPVRELLVGSGWAVALSAIGFALGLVRDATVAAMLAERMSAREKAWVTLSLVGLFSLMAMAADRKQKREVMYLPGAITWESNGVRMEVSSVMLASKEEEVRMRQTGSNLFTGLQKFAEVIGPLPTVFLIHRTNLPGNVIIDGELPAEQGLLLRANFTGTNFSEQQLNREILRMILEVRTHGRASMEGWAWFSDGLPAWWDLQVHGGTEGTNYGQLLRQASSAWTNVTQDLDVFRNWKTYERRAGKEGARATSWAVLTVTGELQGRDAVIRAIQECFQRPVPHDMRGWVRDIISPPRRKFERATGVDFKRLREVLAGFLATDVPPPEGTKEP